MSEISIPVALDPRGNPVPIEEAVRYKTDYYRCPECEEFVNPRKGAVRAHYYAHKQGVLEDKSCSLSSQADVDRMVDELRTSDVEKGEQENQIRLYLGEIPGGGIRLFGVMPSLDWEEIPRGADVEVLLNDISIDASGIDHPPVPSSFHPSESEVKVDLDPSADEFVVEIENGDHLEQLEGRWDADGLSDGDLFLGDQSRARRHRKNRQVKQGEWVYLVKEEEPASLPDLVDVHTLDGFTVLAFPAREETQSLLEEYGEGLTTDQFGFEADVILPASAHPTSEAPIESPPGETVLVGITPSPEIDPVFEVVAIPRRDKDTIEIEPTGPGSPRYYQTSVPEEGSRRVSIHQRNSNRHRLLHLHGQEKEPTPDEEALGTRQLGLEVDLEDETVFLSPTQGQSEVVFNGDLNLASLPGRVTYDGPEGLEIEFTATFAPDAPHGPKITRSTTALTEALPEIGHWATQGCERVSFNFDGLGSVQMHFAEPESEHAATQGGQQ